MKKAKGLGRHILAEFYDCDAAALNNVGFIREIMIEAARIAKTTMVDEVFHEFSPWGVSGVVVIAESHLSVHTWPEHSYAAVDLFTCGQDVDPLAGMEYLGVKLKAKRQEITEIIRGHLDNL